MMTRVFKTVLLSSAAVVAMAFAVETINVNGGSLQFGKAAWAQSGQGKGQGAGGGQGGQGGAGGGGATTPHGKGAPSADSDAKGPQYKGGGKAAPGTQGGKPVWAQEGIPEVELGRLNVSRAPSHVLEKAFYEALSNFDPSKSAALYSMSAEAFAAFVRANYATIVRVDSPLENLGLFKDVRVDGQTQLPGVVPASAIDLAAIFLGSASDKNVAITADTVRAINTILALPALSDAEINSLAAKADAVRLAILSGHG